MDPTRAAGAGWDGAASSPSPSSVGGGTYDLLGLGVQPYACEWGGGHELAMSSTVNALTAPSLLRGMLVETGLDGEASSGSLSRHGVVELLLAPRLYACERVDTSGCVLPSFSSASE
jgi:hypothetical protein